MPGSMAVPIKGNPVKMHSTNGYRGTAPLRVGSGNHCRIAI
jgi:hypothetical protein